MTRVVAFPAYLSLKLDQLKLNMDKVLGSGADGLVVKAVVVDDILSQEA